MQSLISLMLDSKYYSDDTFLSSRNELISKASNQKFNVMCLQKMILLLLGFCYRIHHISILLAIIHHVNGTKTMKLACSGHK